MNENNKTSPNQDGKERDGFFELYGISEEEEAFFEMLYRRRVIYRVVILILGAVLLTLWLWMSV